MSHHGFGPNVRLSEAPAEWTNIGLLVASAVVGLTGYGLLLCPDLIARLMLAVMRQAHSVP